MSRVYLDWNATAPLRSEARAAMAAAMDIVGNPASVHAEGRAARSIIERARAQVAAAFGAASADIVFTSGATEAAALALEDAAVSAAGIEHDCVVAWAAPGLETDGEGAVGITAPDSATLQLANSETGIIQTLPEGLHSADCVQGFGKIAFGFDWSGVNRAFLSAHKIGGPKGVGALVLRRGTEVSARLKGGGQEMGRRAGTENLIGIAGFGAAAAAAARDLDQEVWQGVAELRDLLEARIAAADGAVIIGQGANRLPNTTCIAAPGWKGETQVMQMDLAGFAVSAGSACSSGKVRESRVLRAMGHDAAIAACAIRISIGPLTTRAEILEFSDTWLAAHRKFTSKAA